MVWQNACNTSCNNGAGRGHRNDATRRFALIPGVAASCPPLDEVVVEQRWSRFLTQLGPCGYPPATLTV